MSEYCNITCLLFSNWRFKLFTLTKQLICNITPTAIVFSIPETTSLKILLSINYVVLTEISYLKGGPVYGTDSVTNISRHPTIRSSIVKFLTPHPTTSNG
ncbi:hypothetical protein WN943_017555 [Citrus x changshan-huyou]